MLARAYGFESWPKLKAFVDGATIARFTDAVQAGDLAQVRSLLTSRPELVSMDRAGNDEHRGLHYAVLRPDASMVKLLMEAGADARKGIGPNRDATSALTLAQDREYRDIVVIIEEEERLRREEMSCPNATVSPVQDQISAAIHDGDRATAMRLLEEDRSLIQACDRNGATPLHSTLPLRWPMSTSWHGCWSAELTFASRICGTAPRSIEPRIPRTYATAMRGGFPLSRGCCSITERR